MARFLDGLFETKASPNAADAIARATGSSSAGYYSGVGLGQMNGWDIDRAVRDGVERVTWIFRCVDAIAQKQSTLPIVLRNHYDRKDGEIIDDPRLHRLLNFKANSYERAQQFRYRVSVLGLLSRRGVFIERVNGRDGRPSELHILPPGSTRPIPDPKTFVAGYEITRGDGRIEVLERERVIWLKFKPHPTDPYSQLTPLMSAGIAAETDYLAHLFNRNYLSNDGRPGMLITVNGKLDHRTAMELKSRFEGGPAMAGRVSVLEADGVSVADTTASPRDTQWNELLRASKEEILLAFGVPESVMGNASGRTFDNADAERENFYEDTMLPHCDSMASGMDSLTGDMDDDIVLAFDYSNVAVLQRMAQRKREEKRAEVAMGLATIDDYFLATGQDPWDVVGTRVLYHTSGLAIAKNPDDQAGIMTLRPVGQPQEEGMGNEDSARAGALAGAEAAQRSLNSIVGARALALSSGRTPTSESGSGFKDRLPRGRSPRPLGRTSRVEHKSAIDDDDPERVHPYQDVRNHLEGQIEGIVLGWDTRQLEVIPDRLDHVKSRKGTRHWEGGDKALPKTQTCEYCDSTATKRVLWAEGKAYIPVCDQHLNKAKAKVGSDISGVQDIPQVKALDPKYGVDGDRWAKELEDTMQSVLRKAIKREANYTARQLRDTGVLDLLERDRGQSAGGTVLDRVFGGKQAADDELSRVMDAVNSVVSTAARNQIRRVEDRVAKLDAEGRTIRQIQAEVRKMIGQRSQWRRALAVNITTAAVEGARHAVNEQAAAYMIKQWNAENDERTRTTHRRADGQSRRASSRFRVGKAWLRFPADPLGPIEEIANCRCYVSYSLNDRFYNSGR